MGLVTPFDTHKIKNHNISHLVPALLHEPPCCASSTFLWWLSACARPPPPVMKLPSPVRRHQANLTGDEGFQPLVTPILRLLRSFPRRNKNVMGLGLLGAQMEGGCLGLPGPERVVRMRILILGVLYHTGPSGAAQSGDKRPVRNDVA